METRLGLWRNDRREKQTQPHLTGSSKQDGLRASAWFSDEISEEDKKLLSQILQRYDSKKPIISVAISPISNYEARPKESQSFEDLPF